MVVDAMATPGNDCRLRIGPADGKGLSVLGAAKSVLPGVDGDVVQGALVLYVKSHAVAQDVITAQHDNDVLWSDIAVWDETAALWRTVDVTGNPRVVLKHWEISDGAPNRPARSHTLESAVGRHRLPLWLIAAGVVLVFAAAFALAYFIGSKPGGSQKAHDAQTSFIEAVIAALAALALAISIRRNR